MGDGRICSHHYTSDRNCLAFDPKSGEPYCMNCGEQFVRASKLDRYSKAIELDIADAKAACGGDGEGCETYRGYYQTADRRHQKCSNCPMGATLHIRAASAGEEPPK